MNKNKTATADTAAAFIAMRKLSTEQVQVLAFASRDDGDGIYDKLIHMGEFATSDIATKAGKPRAHVRDWFRDCADDVVRFEIVGVTEVEY